MKICIVGDFSPHLDEGYKNTSHYLAKELEVKNTVIRLNVKRMGTIGFWKKLIKSDCELVHIVAQPTNSSFIFSRLVRWFLPHIVIVISALRAENYFIHNTINPIQKWLIKLVQPDLILVQNSMGDRLFKQLNCPVASLPNGVDLNRFKPATAIQKQQLRKKYNLDPSKSIVLHVGHLHATRNLPILKALIEAKIQVVVAGSLYMGTDHTLIAQLEQAGFRLFKGYQPHVEELYMLSDCYVFPLFPGSSLTMPLSVLEAMACNLPVVTTRFSGLDHIFTEGQGLKFVDQTTSFLPCIQKMLASNETSATRRQVEAFSWSSITDQLQGYYQQVMAGEKWN